MGRIRWKLFENMSVAEGASSRSLYGVGLEQARWCDARGLTEIQVSEHHGFDQLPSPLTFSAALAAVTKAARIRVGALLLPLHDPVRIAEDLIVADLVSEGRMELVVGLGYVREEYGMFGTSAATRGQDADEKLPVLIDCLEGREFAYRGRHGKVLPRPWQDPRPPVLVGGGVKASARRAARFGDGFEPTSNAGAGLRDFYLAECERLGRPRGVVMPSTTPTFVHIAEDPERDWAMIGPGLLHEINLHMKWAAEAGNPSIGYPTAYQPLTDVSVARRWEQFAVLTPEQCIDLARSLPDGAALMMKPLRTAPDIDLGWASLELFVDKVLPHVDIAAPAPTARPIPRR